MSRGERPDLPLFDLPLHGEIDEGKTEPSAGDPVSDSLSDSVSGTATDLGDSFEPEQSQLFDDSVAEGEGDDLAYRPAPEEGDVEEEPFDEDVGVLDRLVGGVVDVALHALVLGVVGGASWLMGVRPSLEDWPAFGGFLLLFSLLYTGVPLAFWGQTPGMMRVGHVARTGSGEPLTFGQTALRWLGALLTLALVGLPLLLALGASSRSLADRVSGSYTESA